MSVYWEKNKWPFTIIISAVILGGFFYMTQTNKQASIERQQKIELSDKHASERRKECLDIYKTESQKYNNVKSWSYIEPSDNPFDVMADTCEIIYEKKDGTTFSNYF